ncbi:hypothetical protein [Nonomuraea sediminis]|uniref:hypothetical protein n=1 Tax=Nonomuraea sediminis TaxID=2835864 RepID=UPI001BDC7188|nr:hypothetical protein [Nonomuraea sediminis]
MKIILSYGLGVDSTAILLRWLTEPGTRWFDLRDLVVVTAQTGDEWVETAYLVEQHIYPLLARHGVRTVQVSRAGPRQKDGIVTLDDTTNPILCLTSAPGAYRLSDELLSVATVPQSGGVRKCSLKFKGWVLDQVIAQIVGDDEFVHVVGFEANEARRMLQDMPLGLPTRIPSYPLIEWGWDRAAAEQYILGKLGVKWPKSACVQCPFAFSLAEGRDRTIPRYLANPHEALLGLTMEHLAVAINPRQGLLAGEQLYDLIASNPDSGPLLELFERRLDRLPWAVYDVRRAMGAKPGDAMARGQTYRSLELLVEGTRADVLARLDRAAHLLGREVETDGRHHRLWLRTRNLYYPCVEHALVVAPALAHDKTFKSFERSWLAGLNGPAQLSLSF